MTRRLRIFKFSSTAGRVGSVEELRFDGNQTKLGPALTSVREELAGLVHSKATIRFPLDARVPARLIARVARLRATEVTELEAARAARSKRPRPATRGERGSKTRGARRRRGR